jgi:hypothetical protein
MIDAMKQALEALEDARNGTRIEYNDQSAYQDEITALRQAIEQAEKQVPVGYFQLDLRMDAWVQNRDNKKGVPFYTAPPKREWVGLTVGEIDVCGFDKNSDACPYDFYQAIEAKLKERNI